MPRLPLMTLLATAAATFQPVDYVNLLAGSFTRGDVFSTGNTLPLVGRPWGFNHWALQTNEGRSAWWFDGNAHEFKWIRCTHQPSPWIGDYGWFMLGPQMGGFASNPTGFFEPRAATVLPHVLDFRTAPDGMRIELVPTMHGASLRVTFPATTRLEKRICLKLGGGGGDGYEVGTGTHLSVDARTNRHSGAVGSNFAHHIRAEAITPATFEARGRDCFCFAYDRSATEVEVHLATSFLGKLQAQRNLALELRPFDEAKAEGAQEWNALLSRASVEDTSQGHGGKVSRDLVVFYTGLYRALTFPRRLDEPGQDGPIHWSPYKAGVQTGTLVTDNGFWDTFRTVYPLLALLYPDHLRWICKGWLKAFEEGGWVPKWASPGYRDSMVGTYGDVVLAEAVVKGILTGADADLAWRALRRDAYEEAPHGGSVGKVGLRVYEQHGYIPDDSGVSDCVSRTLDFAHADWATAQAAKLLSKPEDYEKLSRRATKAVTSSYDSSTGLMRPKSRSGRFSARFDETRWGDGYTEGSPWHHSFPPFDLDLLAHLHGSKEKLKDKILQMTRIPSTFDHGGYGQTIHEMREMRALAMGQYGHNNQPCHHILWLLGLLGYRSDQDRLVREVIDRAYGTDFYAGDEDNGEMGAWFVLSALGLFSVSPASPDYVLGMPLFEKVSIKVPGRKLLEIVAQRSSRDDLDVVATTLDGAELSTSVSFAQIVAGGSLIVRTRNGAATPDASLAAPATPDASLSETRASFWGGLARRTDHAASANPEPTEVPGHHDIIERSPDHLVATAAPVRDHPMLRARTVVPSAPGGAFPFWAFVVAVAAFLLGRGSKRRKNGGKRSSHVV